MNKPQLKSQLQQQGMALTFFFQYNAFEMFPDYLKNNSFQHKS